MKPCQHCLLIINDSTFVSCVVRINAVYYPALLYCCFISHVKTQYLLASSVVSKFLLTCSWFFCRVSVQQM